MAKLDQHLVDRILDQQDMEDDEVEDIEELLQYREKLRDNRKRFVEETEDNN